MVDANPLGWCYQKNMNKSRLNVLALWFDCDPSVASMSFCKSAVYLFDIASLVVTDMLRVMSISTF